MISACYLPKVGYSSDKFLHKFLAESQRNAIAATAVHILEEIALFNRRISENFHQLFNY
jgi:hypothetical protein